MSILEEIQAEIGPCREWIDESGSGYPGRRCNEPSEYVLWGKLIPPDGLGPRCYEHAARWIGHRNVDDPSFALVSIARLARRLEGRDPTTSWLRGR